MKAIGTIVLLLVVGLGVAMFVVTREPERTLDAQGRTWVDGYDAWRLALDRQVTAARSGMTLTTPEQNARLLQPIRGCARALARLGEPPELLDRVGEAAEQACGQAEFALAKNERFGVSALATTKLHLAEAEEYLRVAQNRLSRALDEPL